MFCKKAIFCLLFILITSFKLASKNCSGLDFRLALGPSWHQLFNYKTFDLTQAAIETKQAPHIEIVDTQFNTMAYGEAKLRCSLENGINATFTGCYGKTKKGLGQVQYFVEQDFFTPLEDVQYITPGALTISVAIFDANIGYKFYKPSLPISLNVLGGYVINKESVHIEPAEAITYRTRNNWYGPYIGIEGLFYTKETMIRCWYKCVIGRVNALFNGHAPPDFFVGQNKLIIPFNLGTSTWQQKMFGNLFAIEGRFKIQSNWFLGTTIQYMLYNNRKANLINMPQQRPVFSTRALSEQLYWQQVMWTFWVELCY